MEHCLDIKTRIIQKVIWLLRSEQTESYLDIKVGREYDREKREKNEEKK